MKKLFLINLKILTFCIFLGSAMVVLGQQPPTSGGPGKNPPTSGGYQNVSVDSADVKAAANFAIQEKSKEMKEDLSLESIQKAETQVVAGMNYRLCMVIYVPSKEEQTDGVTLYIQAVIYKNLKNEYKITKWEDDANMCGVEQ